jgi:ABC-type protease/lipase transport system fused ATPase/permease subunit
MSKFWKAALIRAIRTVAQTAVATIGSAAVLSDVNWGVVVSASILAGILSILTSIATGLPEAEGEKDGE